MSRPVTKKEQYLAKAAGITSGTTPPAVTREEHFLKAIADGTGYQSLPTAITKEEQYLKAMTGAPIGNAFYVWHSSMKGGGTNGMPERVFITDDILENGYDLTSHLPYGTLYGGYAKIKDVTMTGDYDNCDSPEPLNPNGTGWTWREMQTESGQRLIPTPGEIYCVKEVLWGFLKLTAALSRTGSTLKGFYVMTAIEFANKINDIGFYVNNTKYPYGSPGSWVYKSYKIGNYTYTVPDQYAFGSYGINGYLAGHNFTESAGTLPQAGDVLAIVPYWVTADGVEVKGTNAYFEYFGSLDVSDIVAKKTDINPPYKPEEEPEENET